MLTTQRARLNSAYFVGVPTCDFCHAEFEARKSGRKQRFCPGGHCRRAFEREARRIGAKSLARRRRYKKSTKSPPSAEDLLIKRLQAAHAAFQKLLADWDRGRVYTSPKEPPEVSREVIRRGLGFLAGDRDGESRKLAALEAEG